MHQIAQFVASAQGAGILRVGAAGVARKNIFHWQLPYFLPDVLTLSWLSEELQLEPEQLLLVPEADWQLEPDLDESFSIFILYLLYNVETL